MLYKYFLVSQGNVVFFASDDALICYSQTYSSFNIFIPAVVHCLIHTLDEVAYVKRIKRKPIIEVIV